MMTHVNPQAAQGREQQLEVEASMSAAALQSEEQKRSEAEKYAQVRPHSSHKAL